MDSFLLDASIVRNFISVFNGIFYLFLIVSPIDLLITIYIILYKNTPVNETLSNIGYHFFTKGLPFLCSLHVYSNVCDMRPDIVSNFYHKYSPFGRGFGSYSLINIEQIDIIKSQLGEKFDYTAIINEKKMVDPDKY